LNPPLHKGFAIGYEKCPDFLDGVFEKEHGMTGLMDWGQTGTRTLRGRALIGWICADFYWVSLKRNIPDGTGLTDWGGFFLGTCLAADWGGWD
jgi:hypothetical protein